MDAQAYFDMQAKAAGDWAAHALIGRPHPEPQLARGCKKTSFGKQHPDKQKVQWSKDTIIMLVSASVTAACNNVNTHHQNDTPVTSH